MIPFNKVTMSFLSRLSATVRLFKKIYCEVRPSCPPQYAINNSFTYNFLLLATYLSLDPFITINHVAGRALRRIQNISHKNTRSRESFAMITNVNYVNYEHMLFFIRLFSKRRLVRNDYGGLKSLHEAFIIVAMG